MSDSHEARSEAKVPEALTQADVGVVGGGPAGMAAALELAACGLNVRMLDEGIRPGGQIHRQVPVGFTAKTPRGLEAPSHASGHTLIAEMQTNSGSITVESAATVWDVAAPRAGELARLWFEQQGRSRLLECRAVVLAPGAFDRAVPFPGWTLPGVITAGAAQVMVRGFQIKPGQRALVAGSGPLILPTVTALLAAGVKVVAALEACSARQAARALRGVLSHGGRLRESLHYAKALATRGLRLATGQTVFRVIADDQGNVARAVIGKVRRDGSPRFETAREIDVDIVCAGFGLIPSIELGQLFGCEAVYTESRGGWHLQVDEAQASNVEGIWAAGEICGIGGGQVAEAEGRVAGRAAARSLGAGRPANGSAAIADTALQAVRDRERRAADAMLRAFPLLPGLSQLATDTTVVCRCEDVTHEGLARAAALHGHDVRAVKMGCRAGMGPCQGRICHAAVHAAIGAGPGYAPQPPCPVAQVPAKPVSAATILAAPNHDDSRLR